MTLNEAKKEFEDKIMQQDGYGNRDGSRFPRVTSDEIWNFIESTIRTILEEVRLEERKSGEKHKWINAYDYVNETFGIDGDVDCNQAVHELDNRIKLILGET